MARNLQGIKKRRMQERRTVLRRRNSSPIGCSLVILWGIPRFSLFEVSTRLRWTGQRGRRHLVSISMAVATNYLEGVQKLSIHNFCIGRGHESQSIASETRTHAPPHLLREIWVLKSSSLLLQPFFQLDLGEPKTSVPFLPSVGGIRCDNVTRCT